MGAVSASQSLALALALAPALHSLSFYNILHLHIITKTQDKTKKTGQTEEEEEEVVAVVEDHHLTATQAAAAAVIPQFGARSRTAARSLFLFSPGHPENPTTKICFFFRCLCRHTLCECVRLQTENPP